MSAVNLEDVKQLVGRTEGQYLKFVDNNIIPTTLANASKAIFCSGANEEIFFISEFDSQGCTLYDNLDNPKFRVKFTRKGAVNCFGMIEKRRYVGRDDWEWMIHFPIFSFLL